MLHLGTRPPQSALLRVFGEHARASTLYSWLLMPFNTSGGTVTDEQAHGPLLAQRVPRSEIVPGRAYLIHSRSGGIGVAVETDGRRGYRVRREKHGEVRLFTALEWGEVPPFGTVIPLRLLDDCPPVDEDALLVWLADQEELHRAEIEANWALVYARLGVRVQ